MPPGLASGITVRHKGSINITSGVLWQSAGFDQNMNAQPGTFELEVKDPDFTYDFHTGDMIELLVDGVVTFGGYLIGATHTFFFPVVDTRDLSKVTRKWKLRGVDFNVLFDKRVLRNPSDYLHHLPNFSSSVMDGALLREALTASKYFDVPTGFDVTTEIDDVTPPFFAGGEEGAWPEQGQTMRTLFEDFSRLSGAIYYIAPDRRFHYKALEDVEARWGFSDRPNRDVVTASPTQFQGATIGFRDGEITREGGGMVNDAFIWGGSEFSGSGQTVFAREENTTSITDHGRWQLAEVHFGEEGYKIQAGVNARADVIVNGGKITELPGGAYNPGLKHEQWSITLSWFSRDVPRIGGVPDHLIAGQLVTFVMYSFGAPLVKTLPLRSVRTSFVALTDDGDAHVKFTGSFGLQPTDPFHLWAYLRGARRRVNRAVSVADGEAPSRYGSYFSGAPTTTPNGSTTVFDLPSGYGYIGRTTEVFVNGFLMQRGTAYTESNPTAGEITFTTAPGAGDWVWIVCRLL